MITRADLEQAIAECQGDRNPNANTCIKLAAFYTIRNEMFGADDQRDTVKANLGYSYAEGPTISYKSDSECASIITGKAPEQVWPIIDELMGTLQATWPKLYNAVIGKLKGVPG